MIYLWAIFFSAALLPAATVSLRVELTESKDPAVRAKNDRSGVVVWLEPVSGPVHPQPRRAEVLQKRKTFVPHVVAVPVGSNVTFPNLDPIFHSAFSNFDGQIFDLGLYPPSTTRGVHFRRPGVVRVFCNIHPLMSAVIVVVNTPYYAASDAAGTITIANVPPGSYRMEVFHERAKPETLAALRRTINVAGDKLDAGALRISESGYLPVQHKNKHGRDYPARIEDTYIGGPK